MYARPGEALRAPRHTIPDLEMAPDSAYQFVRDELMLHQFVAHELIRRVRRHLEIRDGVAGRAKGFARARVHRAEEDGCEVLDELAVESHGELLLGGGPSAADPGRANDRRVRRRAHRPERMTP